MSIGLLHIVGSPRLAVSPEPPQGVFGADQMSRMAERMGRLSTGDPGSLMRR